MPDRRLVISQNVRDALKAKSRRKRLNAVLPKGWFIGTEPAGDWSDEPAIRKRVGLLFSKSMIGIGIFRDSTKPPGCPYVRTLMVYSPEAIDVAIKLRDTYSEFKDYLIQLDYEVDENEAVLPDKP